MSCHRVPGWSPTTVIPSMIDLMSARDRRNIGRLADELGTGAVIEVPYLDHDVHDLAGLLEINRYLFASGRDERVAIAAQV